MTGRTVGNPAHHRRHTMTQNGLIPGLVLLDGFVAGSWRIKATRKSATLTLTPGLLAGDAVKAEIAPATPDFYVENDVVTSAAEVKGDLTQRDAVCWEHLKRCLVGGRA